MTTFYAILVGGTIHGKGGPSTAAVDGPAGPVTAADHIWRDSPILAWIIQILLGLFIHHHQISLDQYYHCLH